jgi:hypothetical protein
MLDQNLEAHQHHAPGSGTRGKLLLLVVVALVVLGLLF